MVSIYELVHVHGFLIILFSKIAAEFNYMVFEFIDIFLARAHVFVYVGRHFLEGLLEVFRVRKLTERSLCKSIQLVVLQEHVMDFFL